MNRDTCGTCFAPSDLCKCSVLVALAEDALVCLSETHQQLDEALEDIEFNRYHNALAVEQMEAEEAEEYERIGRILGTYGGRWVFIPDNKAAVVPDNTAVYVRRGSSPKIGEQLGEQELKADGWRRCAIGQGETQPTFQEKMAKEEKESEAFWNSLSAEQQLQAFCAVMRRIYRGEIEEGRTYRGMLYDVFKFPPKSYAIAQMSGFLTIHNCIWWAVRDTVAAAEETAIRARGQQ